MTTAFIDKNGKFLESHFYKYYIFGKNSTNS